MKRTLFLTGLVDYGVAATAATFTWTYVRLCLTRNITLQ